GAIIARMTNIPVALAAGVGIGVVEGVLLRNFRAGGVTEVTLFVIIVIALLTQIRQGTREEEKGSAWANVQPWRALPEALSKVWVVRNLGWILGLGGIAVMAIAQLWMRNFEVSTFLGLMGEVIV